MNELIKGVNAIITIIKSIWEFLQNLFSTITIAFDIIGRIITIAMEFVLTWPAFIQAFAIITLIISVLYFLIGRQSGKSDSQ